MYDWSISQSTAFIEQKTSSAFIRSNSEINKPRNFL
jgi:hypothetical protein